MAEWDRVKIDQHLAQDYNFGRPVPSQQPSTLPHHAPGSLTRPSSLIKAEALPAQSCFPSQQAASFPPHATPSLPLPPGFIKAEAPLAQSCFPSHQPSFIPHSTTASSPLPLGPIQAGVVLAQSCFPSQQVSLIPPTTTASFPIPLGPIKAEALPAQDCSLFPDWQTETDVKHEEAYEELLSEEEPPAPPPPSPSLVSTAQPVMMNNSNKPAAISCLYCNVAFSSDENLSNHVLSVHGKATTERFCHLCSDVSDAKHDSLVREMHMLLKHALKTFRCSLCGFIEYEMAKIAHHFSTNHVDLGPLNLHQLLSIIERPLCPCFVVSCQDILNSSTAITGEEKVTQYEDGERVTRSPDSDNREVEGFRESGTYEKEVASTDLQMSSSRSVKSEKVCEPTSIDSKTMSALTPASLVSLVAGKSSTNFRQDYLKKSSCLWRSANAYGVQTNASPINITEEEIITSALPITVSLRREVATPDSENYQVLSSIPFTFDSDPDKSITANGVDVLGESGKLIANKTSLANKTTNDGMHSHLNANIRPHQSTFNYDREVQANNYLPTENVRRDRNNPNVCVQTINETVSMSSNVSSNSNTNRNFENRPENAQIFSTSQNPLPLVSQTTCQRRGEGNISAGCYPHNQLNIPLAIYVDPKTNQYSNYSWQPHQYSPGAPCIRHPVDGVERNQVFQNQAMHTNSQIPQWVEQTPSYRKNAVEGNSRESTHTNATSLSIEYPVSQATAYNSSNDRNVIDLVTEISSQSQGTAVYCPPVQAPSITPEVSALPCLSKGDTSEIYLQMPPDGIVSVKHPHTMASAPRRKRTRDLDDECPNPVPQQKRRDNSCMSMNNIPQVINLEKDEEITSKFSPKINKETSPTARHLKHKDQVQETVPRKPRCLSESSTSRCTVKAVTQSKSLENITTALIDKLALHSTKSLMEVGRSQAFDGSYLAIRFCVVEHLLDIKSIFNMARDEIKTILKIECSKIPYVRIQVSVEYQLSTKGVDGVVRTQLVTIHSRCCHLDLCLDSTTAFLCESLMEQFNATQREYSGWSIDRMRFTKFHLFETGVKNKYTEKKGRHDNLCRKGITWPQGVHGAYKVMLFDSQDCLELAMIAHFVMYDFKKYPTDKLTQNQKNANFRGNNLTRMHRGKYFTFPKNLQTPVKLVDYQKIEIETQTSLFLYHLYERSPLEYSFTLLRRGRKNVPERGIIHLVQILDGVGLGLIPDFDGFAFPFHIIKNLTVPELMKSHRFCRFCLSCVKNTEYQRHLQACEDQIDEPNILMPSPGAKYKFQNVAAMTPCYYVAYLSTGRVMKETSTSNQTDGISANLCAYSYCIVSKTGEIARERTEITSNDAASKCLYNLAKDYNELINDLQKNFIPDIRMTKKDMINYNNATHCHGCLKEFNDVTKKIKHHDPLKTGVLNNRGEFIEGNYISALCHICHMRSTLKKRLMPVICLNSSPSDYHLLMKNLDESLLGRSLQVFSITPNTLHYFSAAIERSRKEGHHGVRIINLDNFMAGHSSDLAQMLVDSRSPLLFPRKLLRQAGYGKEVLDLAICNTGLFPYRYLVNFDKLSETKLPSKEHFKKNQYGLKTSNIFVQSQNLWTASKCKTLKDYLILHLKTEASVLAEIFQTFRNKVIDEHKLDPACYPSIQNFCIDAALYKKPVQIDLITNKDLFKLFEQNRRENLMTLVKPYVKYNNQFCPDFDPCKPIESGLLLKFNSIYGTILSSKLPVGNIETLTDAEILEFDLVNAECDGKYAYALEIDFTIPDETKKLTDDLPLSIIKKMLRIGDLSPFTSGLMKRCGIRSDIGSSDVLVTHEDQRHYLISLQMLQLYMELGLEVEKVYKIIRLRQEKCFDQYVSKNVNLCKNAENPWEKAMFQLLTSSSLTKSKGDMSGMNKPRNFFVRPARRNDNFKRISRSNSLKYCGIIGEMEAFMVLSEPDVTLDHPTYINFFIQEKLNFIVYNFYYNVLKKYYQDNVSLVYCDKDTLLVSLKNVNDVFRELKDGPLKNHLDTSNFPGTHPLHDISVRDEFGRLKCVAADKLPAEVVGLQPGIFSIRYNEPTSGDGAGNNHALRYHEHLKRIHLSSNRLEKWKTCREACESCLIQEENFVIPKIDHQRYYLNSEESLGYGHPAIRRLQSVGHSMIN